MVGSLNGPKHRGETGFYDQNRHWRTFPELLPDDQRVLPQTVPDGYLATHRLGCGCPPCSTYSDQRKLRSAKLRYAARHRQ